MPPIAKNLPAYVLIGLSVVATGCGREQAPAPEAKAEPTPTGEKPAPQAEDAGEAPTAEPKPAAAATALTEPIAITLPAGEGWQQLRPLGLVVYVNEESVTVGRWGRKEDAAADRPAYDSPPAVYPPSEVDVGLRLDLENEVGGSSSDETHAPLPETPTLLIDRDTPNGLVAKVIAQAHSGDRVRLAFGSAAAPTMIEAAPERHAGRVVAGAPQYATADFELQAKDDGVRVIVRPRIPAAPPGGAWWEGPAARVLSDGGTGCELAPAKARAAIGEAIEELCKVVPRPIQIRLSLREGKWGPLAESLPVDTSCPVLVTLDAPKVLVFPVDPVEYAPPLDPEPAQLCARAVKPAELVETLIEDCESTMHRPDQKLWRALWDADREDRPEPLPHPKRADRVFKMHVRDQEQTAAQNVLGRVVMLHRDDALACRLETDPKGEGEALFPKITWTSGAPLEIDAEPEFDACMVEKMKTWELPELPGGPHVVNLMLGFAVAETP